MEFHASYVTARSRVMSDSQTALALLLHFDLLDPTKPDQKAIFAQRLEHHVVRDFWQVSTGFAGTPIILHTLAANDKLHHAYRMLLARDCPSWLSPVLLGATTIWERWDSMLADGSINPGNMTSFNHYALGAVANFLHSVVGGLSPASPGWQSISIKPRPGGNLTWANTSFQSPYGLLECQWKIVCDKLQVDVTVPPNASARVELPNGTIEEVGSGRRQYSVPFVADERFPPKFIQPEFSRPVDKDWVR
jgi:alpha-L-rhamnosidase